MNKSIIKFRPHHFLCSIAYKGLGYSKAFVKNYDLIIGILKNNEETNIQVVKGFDNICQSCPHKNLQLNNCDDEPIIQKLDKAHQSILGLKDQEILTFSQAKQKIKSHMSIKLFHEACKPCEWKKLGICETALQNLINEK